MALAKVTILLLGLCASAATGMSFDVCGNFCGPSWCNGKQANECLTHQGVACTHSECDFSGNTDGSCADACCKQHDTCCGSMDRTPCNNNIISCLKQCAGKNTGGTCWRDGVLLDVPVSADVVLAGMEVDPYGCCGSSCDTANHKDMALSQREPNATGTGPAWTRGGIEPPSGVKDMGGWSARVYSTEQMGRLGVDEDGKKPASTNSTNSTQ